MIVSLNPKSKCNWFDFARLTRTYFSTTRKALRCGLTCLSIEVHDVNVVLEAVQAVKHRGLTLVDRALTNS